MGDNHPVTPVFPGPLSETLPSWRGFVAKEQLTTPDRVDQSNSQMTPTWSPRTASPASQSSSLTTTTVESTPPLDSSREGAGAVLLSDANRDETTRSDLPIDSQPVSSSNTILSHANDGKDLNAAVEGSSAVAPPEQVERRATPATVRVSRSAASPATQADSEAQSISTDRGEAIVPSTPIDGSTAKPPLSLSAPSVSLGGSKLGFEGSKQRNAKVGSSKPSRGENTTSRRGTPMRAAAVGARRKSQRLKSVQHEGYNRTRVSPGTSKVRISIKPDEGRKGDEVRTGDGRPSSKSVSSAVSDLSSVATRRKPSGGEEDLEEGGAKTRNAGTETTRKVHPPAPASMNREYCTHQREGRSWTGVALCTIRRGKGANYYLKSGRILLLATGTVVFISLFSGVCLLTLASAYFYWFALPGIFMLVYFICYMILSFKALGRDLDMDMHAEIIRKGAEQAYRPMVDIFLPVCKEPLGLLENTWTHVSKLDYPNLTVYVLDDGGQDDVRELAETYGFQYFRRDNRPEMKKAGNLRHAFSRTSGQAYAIFDADFCPRPDFLHETVPYLLDPSIGIVQSPQFFRWRQEQTWTERGAGPIQEFFYRLEQMNRDACGACMCVGSCGLYRRTAVEPFGGVAAIEHSEDMYTGFKMTELGYKVKYLPICMAMGICPDEPRTYFMQQYRWCKGTVSLVFEKDFWRSKLSFTKKLCFLNGMMYYISTALFVFLAPLPVLLLVWIRADGVLWFHTGFTVPSIIFTTMVIPFWAQSFKGVGMVQRMWRVIACFRVQIIQSYAYIYAIKDYALGISAPWAPSGGGATRSSSKAYDSSVWLLLIWNVLSTTLVAGGAILRMMTFPWYHFVPAVALVVSNCLLSFSTLYYR